MSPRTGRPRKENAKTDKVTICLDKTTREKLNQYCERENVSRSEAVRRGVGLLVDKEKE